MREYTTPSPLHQGGYYSQWQLHQGGYYSQSIALGGYYSQSIANSQSIALGRVLLPVNCMGGYYSQSIALGRVLLQVNSQSIAIGRILYCTRSPVHYEDTSPSPGHYERYLSNVHISDTTLIHAIGRIILHCLYCMNEYSTILSKSSVIYDILQ